MDDDDRHLDRPGTGLAHLQEAAARGAALDDHVPDPHGVPCHSRPSGVRRHYHGDGRPRQAAVHIVFVWQVRLADPDHAGIVPEEAREGALEIVVQTTSLEFADPVDKA
jgi:hypothetical protein